MLLHLLAGAAAAVALIDPAAKQRTKAGVNRVTVNGSTRPDHLTKQAILPSPSAKPAPEETLLAGKG